MRRRGRRRGKRAAASAARLASGMPSSHSGIQPKAVLSARAAGSESMAMAPRNSAPSSQAAKGGAAASSVAAAWERGRLAGVMAVVLGYGATRGGGTYQQLRPGGA